MLDAVRARTDGLQSIILHGFVDGRPKVPPVRCSNQLSELRKCQSWPQMIVNKFQVVRTLRNSRIHKRLSLIIWAKHRVKWPLHFTRMSAWHASSNTGGSKIGCVGM